MAKRIKIFNVDDNESILQTLETLLKLVPDVELVGSATNIDDAKIGIVKTRPDLLLLDIHFPGNTGFELLIELKQSLNYQMRFIFITTHKDLIEPALGFLPDAILLKPIHPDLLKDAIEKHRGVSPKQENQLYFKTEGKDLFVLPSEVLWVEADGRDCFLFLANGQRKLIPYPFKDVLKMLGETDFIQTHRSYLVKIAAISGLNKRHTTCIIRNNSFSNSPSYTESRYSDIIKALGL